VAVAPGLDLKKYNVVVDMARDPAKFLVRLPKGETPGKSP
jgi:hypothetical protein